MFVMLVHGAAHDGNAFILISADQRSSVLNVASALCRAVGTAQVWPLGTRVQRALRSLVRALRTTPVQGSTCHGAAVEPHFILLMDVWVVLMGRPLKRMVLRASSFLSFINCATHRGWVPRNYWAHLSGMLQMRFPK